ncbi:MAG: DNA-processing protein DprA [Oceanospirillaceae bacterium]
MLSRIDRLLLALSLLPKVGRKKIKLVVGEGGLKSCFSTFDLQRVLGELNTVELLNFLDDKGALLEKVNNLDSLMQDNSIQMLNPSQDLFPVALQQIPDSPAFIFYRGNPSVLSRPQIAIVGSRKASSSSLNNAYLFAQKLAMSGFVVTSGLAQGVDIAVHRGVLDVGKATIAVMGTGLDRIYPVQHKKFADAILDNGCWVSEYLPGMKALPSNFPRRNRIISGLSLGVLIVEARVKSGTLITARMALEQNREVFAIPGPIEYEGSKGCHELIKQGAKLVESIGDICEEFPGFSAVQVVVESMEAQLPNDLSGLLKCIDFTFCNFNQIVFNSSISPIKLTSHLVELELLGYIESNADNYRRIKK